MGMLSQPVKLAGLLLIVLGILIIGRNIAYGGTLNLGLPLVFLMLGGMFIILVFATRDKWAWAPVLYIPGALLLAFGLIFLLNVLTNDWNAWAYAWLLLVAGTGVGMALANRQLALRRRLPPWINLAGWGMAAGGVTLFALFGAIAGGLFIQIMAPILLVAGGLALYWARPERLLPERILRRMHISPRQAPPPLDSAQAHPGQNGRLAATAPAEPVALREPPALVEPLSARELEVLRLVDQGLSNQQIADHLTIAASTVKTHINNIYGKLGVETRVQAIRRARELDLLD